MLCYSLCMPKQKRFSRKQEKLKAQLPLVAAGEKTKKQALLDSGYAESSASQQSVVFGLIRSPMQEALKKHSVDEERIAQQIDNGLEEDGKEGMVALGYTKLAAELIDAFPSKKVDVTLSNLSHADLDRRIREAAKNLTEEEGVGRVTGGKGEESEA